MSGRDFNQAAVVITGAGSGVGAAVCAEFAKRGAHLLLVGRDENKLQQTQQQLQTKSAICPGDIGDSAFCEKALDMALSNFGRLDVVVNNAGQIHRGSAQETSDEQWRRIMRVNLDGVFWLCSSRANARRVFSANRRANSRPGASDNNRRLIKIPAAHCFGL